MEVRGVLDGPDQPVKRDVKPLGVQSLLEGVNVNFDYPMEIWGDFFKCMQNFSIVLYGQPE